MQDNHGFFWPHKDLLDTEQLSQADIYHILDTANRLEEVCNRSVKKVPILRGKSIVLFFAEPSTRTKMSFEIASKRLSADTLSFALSGSSFQKGESFRDTALTLQAMNPDIIVLRHTSSGAPQFLAERLSCSIVNAGDGWHAHPTQALLDVFSLQQIWGNAFNDKKVLIVGDIAHSRVCRSNITLLSRLGVDIRLCAPRTLLPSGIDSWPVTIYADLKKAVQDVDAIMCLRIQSERQKTMLLPSLHEYAVRFCLTPEHMIFASPHAKVLHPGPFLRGIDVSSAVVDSPHSLVFDQVAAGVAVRMAVLFLSSTRNDVQDI